MAWHFVSLLPDSLLHWAMKFILPGDWHCSSLGSDLGPHCSLTLVLTTSRLISIQPDCHAHKDLILVLYTLTLFLSRHWFSSSLDLILVQSMTWIWSFLHPKSGPLYSLTLVWQPDSLPHHCLTFCFTGSDFGPSWLLTHYALTLWLTGNWH